jgi:membrane fusion protein (multidrug efflux system)
MNRSTKIVLFSAIALLIAGMALYPTIKKQFIKEGSPQEAAGSGSPAGGAPGGGQRGSRGTALNVNAKIVQPETLVNVLPATTAKILPDEEVDLTFEAAGKIIGIYFQEGTSVKKGDLLAKVNDRPLQADLQKLQAQLPLAESRVFRQQSLLERDAVSREAYELVVTELDKLHADIELIKARIAQTELRAPFDGIIGLRNVSEGAFVTSSTIITNLTKIIPIKLEFAIAEEQADEVFRGMQVSFQVRPDLNTYIATIYALESYMDPATLTLKVRALYPNTDGRVRPGRSANVEVRLNPIENAVTAPNESIIKEMGIDYAYIYSGGVARQVALDIGMRTESRLQIINGLNVGDTLIVSGVMQLREGLPVIIDNIIN